MTLGKRLFVKIMGKGENLLNIMISDSETVENIVGKGENAFISIFPQCFQ